MKRPKRLRRVVTVPSTKIGLTCDCGGTSFMTFGPYDEERSLSTIDIGLRWIFTCTACDEQLRVYQTSNAWRWQRETRGMTPEEQERLIAERERVPPIAFGGGEPQ